MKWLDRIFCKHSWYELTQHMIHAGTGKMIIHKCNKCGKERARFV